MRRTFRQLALGLFCIYVAVLPGSTITVMLDRIPDWGTWMGGALLMLQGALLLCWLIGNYGHRGALVGLLIFLLAWLVEHIGVTTGVPFGRYRYTTMLQPQLLGIVPLPIPCAWLMVALGAWQLAARQLRRADAYVILVAATLLMLLDVQIETVATAINHYWLWLDSGRYYGVPLSNFVAWWAVGGLIALIVARGLPHERPHNVHEEHDALYPQDAKGHLVNPVMQRRCSVLTQRRKGAKACFRLLCVFASLRLTPSLNKYHANQTLRCNTSALRRVSRAAALQRALPSWLYVLNSLMFTAINLARGYIVAGLVGLTLLLALTFNAQRGRGQPAATSVARQTSD